MQFDVMISIEAHDPDDAAEQVSGWTVSPGAVLKFIVSSQPVTVTHEPIQIDETGEIRRVHRHADEIIVPQPVVPTPVHPSEAAEVLRERREAQAAEAERLGRMQPQTLPGEEERLKRNGG
jgi:hypothetical protein